MKKKASTRPAAGKSLTAQYDPAKIESKWQAKWAKSKIYRTSDDSKKQKYYILDMFPYPSGEGLHVGHPKGYIATDIVSRFQRMNGKSVLHPMGFDAFGLPAENYALKTKTHPEVAVKKNVARYKKQLEILGFDYDWSREINTTDPEYYKWTQWIFLQLLKKGLAFESYEPINWCPVDKTGLANEDIENGRCERCGALVEKKLLRQWVLKITDYADRLLKDLDAVEYDMPKLVDKTNPHQPGKPLVKRNVAHAIVFDPKNKKYLIIRNKKFNWDTVIIGGIEEGEDAVETARREVREETGYTDLEFKRLLGGQTEAHYYTKHKGENRIAFAQAAYFELKSDARVPLASGEDAENEILWIGEKDFVPGKMVNSELGIWLERLAEEAAATTSIQVTEGPFAFKAGLPIVERDSVLAIVKHWKEDRYLVLSSKKHSWKTFVIGGIEKGEDPAGTVRRETAEETGFKDIKSIKQLGGTVSATHFAPHKNENRLAHVRGFYVELASGAQTPVAEDESAHQQIEWVEARDMAATLQPKITDWVFWQRLLKEKAGTPKPLLDWPESIKELQRNWIGRSEGALIKFPLVIPANAIQQNRATGLGIQGAQREIEVFTTRPDTLFGVTYVVLAPEHKLVPELLATIENKAEVEAYIEQVKNKTEIDRMDATKEKTGVELKGIKTINPANKEEVPVWIADYVLADYGTGAVMAVPAHDERDWKFAKKFGLPVKQVIEKSQGETELPYTGEGIVIDSELYPWMNGLLSEDARQEIVEELEHQGLAKEKVTYKLRDWVFSRQRYWGEPIPVIHCELHSAVPVPEKDLPVKLPNVKSYEPTGTGESPLAAISKWVNTKCPQCIADKKKTKYFIFDFDGVLGDTWNAALEAHVNGKITATQDEAALRMRAYFSKKPFHARDQSMSGVRAKENEEWIRNFGSEMAKIEFNLFKSFIKEIKKFKRTKFAVVSSGSNQYVTKALKKAGMKFSHVLAYEDHHSKEEKIERIRKDWKADVKDIYYFTDTKADVYELEDMLDRKKIIGCAWGYQGYELLKEVLPEKQILKDFEDIHRFFNVDCKGRRETNTMPQWAGSSWYYLRFEYPKNRKTFVDAKKEKYWSPVDLYVGGAEHATRHLIYARFWHKFLFDQGFVSGTEPFKKLQHVGLIMGEDGLKMSKRTGNVVNPDDIVATYGADTLRIYEMFMGPFDQQIAWSTESMVGPRRFIERVWKLREKVQLDPLLLGDSSAAFAHPASPSSKLNARSANASSQEMLSSPRPDSSPTSAVNVKPSDAISSKVAPATKIIHKAIQKVSEDIQGMRFNTAISTLMIAVNEIEKTDQVARAEYETLLKLLAPFAPHVAEELWMSLGNKKSIHVSSWPEFDPALAADDEVTIVVQINGKMRASFAAASNSSREELERMAHAAPEAKKWLEGKKVLKVIVVPNKLVNIVVAQ